MDTFNAQSTVERLNAIVEEKAKENNVEVRKIPISKIIKDFSEREEKGSYEDDISFAKLMASIKEVGLLQPIVVLEMPNGYYKKIAGGRRIRVFELLQKDTIPAVVFQELDDKLDIYKMMIDENNLRKNLSKNEQVEVLLKILALTFKKYENPTDEELIEDGKNIFRQVYNLSRKRTTLTPAEEQFLMNWKTFAEKFDINIHSFKEDILIFTLKEPFLTYYKENLITKKLALKLSGLLKNFKGTWFDVILETKRIIKSKKIESDEDNRKIRDEIVKTVESKLKAKAFFEKEIEKIKKKLQELPELENKSIQTVYLLACLKLKNEKVFEKILTDIENKNAEQIKNEIVQNYIGDKKESKIKKGLETLTKIKNIEKRFKRNVDKFDLEKIKQIENKIEEIVKILKEEGTK